jgi:hypothetical protein
LGVLQSIRANEEQQASWRAALSNRPILTAESILELYEQVEYSDKGSNKRIIEEEIMTFWCDFVMDLGGWYLTVQSNDMYTNFDVCSQGG